jgi:hypothetical protein
VSSLTGWHDFPPEKCMVIVWRQTV